jgi:hypothetical protein
MVYAAALAGHDDPAGDAGRGPRQRRHGGVVGRSAEPSWEGATIGTDVAPVRVGDEFDRLQSSAASTPERVGGAHVKRRAELFLMDEPASAGRLSRLVSVMSDR